MAAAGFPSDESECIAWELDYWARRMVDIAEGRCTQQLPRPCSMLAVRQSTAAARALLDRALAALDTPCPLTPTEA
jgi:hypothetical protein